MLFMSSIRNGWAKLFSSCPAGKEKHNKPNEEAEMDEGAVPSPWAIDVVAEPLPWPLCCKGLLGNRVQLWPRSLPLSICISLKKQRLQILTKVLIYMFLLQRTFSQLNNKTNKFYLWKLLQKSTNICVELYLNNYISYLVLCGKRRACYARLTTDTYWIYRWG